MSVQVSSTSSSGAQPSIGAGSFHPLTTHRVATMGFAAIQAIEAHSRRRQRRSTDMTKAERRQQATAIWEIPAPNNREHQAYLGKVTQWVRGHETKLTVALAMTQSANGDELGTMATMTFAEARAITFPTLNEEQVWPEFSRYLSRCLTLNMETTTIVFGDNVATPLATPQQVQLGQPQTLVVRYAKDPAKSSVYKANSGSAPLPAGHSTAIRFVAAALPSTMMCGHQVPFLCNSWSPSLSRRQRAFCMTCLDPIIDLLQAYEMAELTPAVWDKWIAEEEAEPRRAALRELRAYPWVSREWIQVVRMAGVMFGVADPYSPEFAATLAVYTNARLEVQGQDRAALVLEWMREDVVRGVVWAEDELPLSGQFAPFLFDWVEAYGRPTFIQSRSDVYWYLDQYCALADPAKSPDQARATLPSLPPAQHTVTATTLLAKYPGPALENACTKTARLFHAASEASTPRSRRSRFSTATSGTSTESSASQLSDESFAALVSGRLRARTSSAEPAPVAHAHEVEPGHGVLVSGLAGVAIAEAGEPGGDDE